MVHAIDQCLFKEIQPSLLRLTLYFVFYSFMKIHKTLHVTPAMQAGLSDRAWEMEDMLALIDARKQEPK